MKTKEEIIEGHEVFDNIFEAFKHFAPCSPLIQLENDECRMFRRTNHYEMIDMQDGTFAAFPNMMFMQCYRGENDVYETCEANIYRNHKMSGTYDEEGILIDEIRCQEFKNILLTFPQVKMALQDHMRIDFLALAEHYELNTRLLDISSEPEISAYFATHRWENGTPVPIEKGIGCIRGLSPMMYMNMDGTFSDIFHAIGLQCFQRPGLQAAFGIETNMGEDVSGYGWCVYFRQDLAVNMKIHMNFHYDAEKQRVLRNSWLFPEEDIADVARVVKNTQVLSRKAVTEYCAEHQSYEESVLSILKHQGIRVSNKPVFQLSADRILELTSMYRGRMYGDVQLNGRFCYRPEANG
ncbi:MAG: FRG domain-containing protein [Lachnospiraceae bacterium]|nr:FRG domain-containing protein [Lachnospiraceae bacterium]